MTTAGLRRKSIICILVFAFLRISVAIQASVMGKFFRGKPFLNLNKRLRAQKEQRPACCRWGHAGTETCITNSTKRIALPFLSVRYAKDASKE